MTGFKKPGLFETEAGREVLVELERISKDKTYTTRSSYAPNSEIYPGNKMTFVEKHREYLRAHPNTDPQLYLSNLRLMTRK